MGIQTQPSAASSWSLQCLHLLLAFWWISYLSRLAYLARSWLCVKQELLLSQTLAENFTHICSTNLREVFNTLTSLALFKGGMQSLAATYGKLMSTNSTLKEEIIFLIKETDKERSRHSRKQEVMGEVLQQWSSHWIGVTTIQINFSKQ